MGKGKRQEEKRGEKEKAKGEKKVKVEALEIIGRFSGNSLPSLVVFDLDYTLWPFYSYQFFFFLDYLIIACDDNIFHNSKKNAYTKKQSYRHNFKL
jgi:Acid Phosphatase